MAKKIIAIIGFLIVVVVIFVLSNKNTLPTLTPATSEQDEADKVEISPDLPEMTLPLSNNPKDVAWALFQKYLRYNKNQDLEGVRSVVHRVAAVCEDLKTTVDCKARMALAYQYGSTLKKEDFKNVWDDKKQTILSTDFTTREDDSIISRSRGIIFFIKTETGLEMLSFSPSKGVVASKGAASQEELNYRIVNYTKDEDQDGLADYDEECLAVKEGETCQKTNPKIRDTDDDGWWDGVEVLF